MDFPGTPSAAGPSRRSRRLQGTPAANAAGSPYARRPPLPRDPSSQVLADLEGGSANSFDGESSTFASARKDVAKANRRKSAGPEGLFGRVRKSLGWLVGRASTDAAEEEGNDEETLQEPSPRAADEESALDGRNTAASRSMQGFSRPTQLPSGIPPPPPKRSFAPQTASIASRSQLGSMQDEEDPHAPKRLRTSHSTLNLPTAQSVPSRLAHASDGPPSYARSRSPLRNPSPSRLGFTSSAQNGIGSSSRSDIFQSGPLGLPSTSKIHRPASPSRRSVSPGGMSQTLLAQPTSATSSVFGLTSQSPFRTGGHSARSPDFSVLNISSGLARSPSLPRERMAVQQGSRLYPYQRSPSVTSSFARPAGTLQISYSLNTGLGGTKRGFSNISASSPRISPIHGSLMRQQSYAGSNISPTSTDFSMDNTHRAKRPRMSVVWDPERGFVASDADGRPVQEEPKQEVPKNEAERILERLENLRRPQLQGLRNKSPQRINVPLPAADTPTHGNIFATRITGSQTMPSLANYAISPIARRLQAAEGESASQRDRLRANGGLGERMRRDRLEQNRRKHASQDTHESEQEEIRSERDRSPQRNQEASEQEDEVDELPQPTQKRRTRQRTRELSVMSDASETQEEAFSPRRSTRNKGKGKAREESAEPQREQPKRQPKSAKSPPPVKRSPTKNSKKGKQTEVHSDEEMNQDQDEPAPSKAKRSTKPERAVSPPAKAPAKGSKKRPASPAPQTEAAPSIDQVMHDEAPKPRAARISRSPAREVAPILARRPPNGFSAKDVEDDEMVVEQDNATSRPRTAEMAKLKLPISVFANRFSFGKSPSSPVLAAQKDKLPEVPAAGALSTALPDKVDSAQAKICPTAATPPAFSLGPASAASAAPASETAAAKPPTSFSFGTPSATSPQTTAPAAAAPQFSFGKPAEKSAEAGSALPSSTPAPPGGMFSFKTPSSTAPSAEPAPAVPAASKPMFDFKAPAPSASAADTARPAKPPLFSFGVTSNESKADEKVSTPSAPAVPAIEKATAPAPVFSFGKSNGAENTTAAVASPTVATATSSNPFAAFPGPSKAPVAVPETPAKAPSFSFGTTNTAPSLSFGKAAETDKAAQAPAAAKPNFSSFSFTPASPAAPTKDANAMSDSPPAASTAQPAATTAPFSPVLSASKTPSFTFGQPAAATPAAASSAPAFNFGSAANKPAASEAAKPANPFGGTSSSGSFTFGATPSIQPAAASASAGSQKPFSFTGNTNASSNGGSAPAFTFGQPVASPAAATPATSNPFGGASTAGSAKPTGLFGGVNSTPGTPNASPSTFSFGNTAPAAGSPAQFTFGQAAPSANGASTPSFGGGTSSSFSFGAGNTTPGANVAAPFVFGSNAAANGQPAPNFGAGTSNGATTPGGTAMAGGSGMFNVGSGDGSTSPGKRVIKPMRTAKRK